MTRRFYIERVLRQIYGGQPSDDADITVNLVNSYLNDGVAFAAKQCYKEAIQLEGIGYVNNSFYSTFKGIAITEDETFLYKLTLPQIPLGIGRNEAVSSLKFKNTNGSLSLDAIPLSQAQKGYFESMRPIPNKILFYPEGEFIYVVSDLQLWDFTATVTMISGGDSTNLGSTINVPDDYFPIVTDYIKGQLGFERVQPVDAVNDGADFIKTV